MLVTVLSPAAIRIRGVLRTCSGGTEFAGALDGAIDRRSADGSASAAVACWPALDARAVQGADQGHQLRGLAGSAHAAARALAGRWRRNPLLSHDTETKVCVTPRPRRYCRRPDL